MLARTATVLPSFWRRRSRRAALATAVLLGCWPGEGRAQNLAFNPHFDTNAAGWALGNGSWDSSRDADGAAGAGSIRSTAVANQPVAPGDLSCGAVAPLSQCIDGIVSGATYSFGAQVYLPAGQAAAGLGASRITWASGSGCAGKLLAANGPFIETSQQPGRWAASAVAGIVAPATARSVELTTLHCLRVMGTLQANFDDLFFVSTTLLLHGGRFKVDVTWSAQGGRSGLATPIRHSADTGDFWFFDPANVEMVVKVLDGCAVNGRYWVFAGGLTNVHVAITVTDSQSGKMRTYSNPLGKVFQPIQDTGAFATCP